MPLPSQDVSFNADHVSMLAKSEKPAAGYFAFLVTEAEQHEPKKDDNFNIMSHVSLRMLKDPEDAESTIGLPVHSYITWPLSNPDDPEHEPPRYGVDQSIGFLSAIFPDRVSDIPRRDGKKLIFRGEEIDADQEKPAREAAIGEGGPVAEEVYRDHSQLVGHLFYAQLYYSKKSPTFPSLRDYSNEKQADLSDVYIMTDEGGPSDNGVGAGKGGRGGKTRRTGGKKRGSSRRKSV